MSIVSSALITALADFGVKVLVRLAIKLHKGPAHELAEKYKEELRKAGK